MTVSISVPPHRSTISVDNFKQYLTSVDRVLSGFDSGQNQQHYFEFSQLQQTLIDLEVARIRHSAISQGVWDFYPTCQHIIQKMLTFAQVLPHHRVLEPSAGAGDLAVAIADYGVNKIDCFEIHPLLRQALKLQNFKVLGSDFLIHAPEPIYDRIIANPPFGSNGVANHTIHAFQFLKPGGRLVSLAHHYQLQPSKCDRAFFDWLSQHHARFLNLGAAFKNSDRPTNIPLQLIVIDK